VRLYYKLAISLAKQHTVWLITTNGVVNATSNPYQMVVDSESPWRALWQLHAAAKGTKARFADLRGAAYLADSQTLKEETALPGDL